MLIKVQLGQIMAGFSSSGPGFDGEDARRDGQFPWTLPRDSC